MSVPGPAAARTFLQLCQRTAKECGVANASISPIPTTVNGQIGELSRVIDYVADAWRELQGNRLWNWMWENPTITVPALGSTLATGIPHDRWVKDAVYVPGVTSDTAGRFLDYLPWDQFKATYPRILAGSSLSVWTIAPDNSFRINGLVPAGAGYDLTVERYANPTALVADDDVPPMPADLQMLLVYTAMRKYGAFDEAGTQVTVAQAEEKRLKADLFTRCLPAFRLGGSILDNL